MSLLVRVFGLLLAGSLLFASEGPLDSKSKVVVLVFMSSECPISNKVAPEIERLYRKFATNGVAVCAVYPNQSDTTELIDKHRKEYRLTVPCLRDPKHELVRKAGVAITPEAAVFNERRSVVYRGRITDQFLALGKSRPEATAHDLEEAITAALAGQAPRQAHLPAVGCYIEDR